MNIFIARQPVFDRRMHLYGYELLYRQSHNNYYEGVSDNQATASVLANAFLAIDFNRLIDGTRGLINFSKELLSQEIPRLLPADKVIVEILERVEPSEEVIRSCQKLKSLGYTLALDDFAIRRGDENQARLIDLADIVKIEFPKTEIRDQIRFMNRYRGKIQFLAEKIETAESFNLARRMGYSLFQGYYFSRPVLVNAKDIASIKAILTSVQVELRNEEPNFNKIAGWIEKDIGLTYKLLKVANKIDYRSLFPVQSIRQAVARIGVRHLRQWIYLMLLRDVQNPENEELVKTSLIRGKLLAMIAVQMRRQKEESDYFITGIFSSLDCLLNETMDRLVNQLPLTQNIKDALLGKENELRAALNAVLAFESADWDRLNILIRQMKITEKRFMDMYIQALKWQQELPF